MKLSCSLQMSVRLEQGLGTSSYPSFPLLQLHLSRPRGSPAGGTFLIGPWSPPWLTPTLLELWKFHSDCLTVYSSGVHSWMQVTVT